MNDMSALGQISLHERWLLRIDRFPVDAVFRTSIGFAMIPAMSRLRFDDRSVWSLLAFLLALLLGLRVGCAVARKLGRFSEPVKRFWAERRQLAKRYDSYQWRKLFWIGIGLVLFTVYSGQYSASRLVVASLCLVAGTLGIARWRLITRRLAGSTRRPERREACHLQMEG